MFSGFGYYALRDELVRRVSEPAPGRIQILSGPRQVGKTTLLLDLASRWGASAVYLAVDAPEGSLPGWWDRQWRRVLEMAGQKRVLLLDEIQYLPDWSRRIKSAVDEVYRKRLPIHIVLTGSAALTVGAGTRETMAGRFERLVLRQWTPRDLSQSFGWSQEESVDRYVRFGSFPGGVNLLENYPRWRSYILDSIIDPAVGRDLLMLESIRRPALLRQLFAVCTGHATDILSLNKIAGVLSDPGTLETISHYLTLLEEAYLVCPVQKHSSRELRRRSSPPKLICLNNAFLAAGRVSPMDPLRHPEHWGRWVENACLAFALAGGQTVRYWREEPLEADAVFSGSWGQWAVEIKTGSFGSWDLTGLGVFCERFPEYRPLVLCDPADVEIPQKLGFGAMSWRQFLWEGIPG